MALDIDTGGLRRSGDLVEETGTVLAPQLGEDVPACGGDAVSMALMENLNAWQRWLVEHVRAGAEQAFNAAAAIEGSAAAYEAEDLAAAARYPGGGHGAPNTPTARAISALPAAGRSPAGLPARSPIPDISGQEGEQLALELESGAGTGPALAAAALMTGLATQSITAHTALSAAHTQLIAAGEAGVSKPLAARLIRAIAWTQVVAGHAGALADGYTAAAGLHSSTQAAVGPSAHWRQVKALYREALIEQQLTGLAAPKVHGYRTMLTGMRHSAGTAMVGYQGGGKTATTPPGTLPNPGLDPHAQNTPGGPTDPSSDDGDYLDDSDTTPPTSDKQSGLQDMFSPLMSALGPLLQSVGQSNPLQSLSQLGQQLGQQSGIAKGANLASATSRPALPKPNTGAGHKAGGGAIKPAASLSSAIHPAALTGSPPSSPSVTPMKPAPATRGASAGTAGGMGVMPMGQHSPNESIKITSYEQPLAEIESTGRPGVVGDTAKADPLVKPEVHNAVKARMAARKKEAAPTADT